MTTATETYRMPKPTDFGPGGVSLFGTRHEVTGFLRDGLVYIYEYNGTSAPELTFRIFASPRKLYSGELGKRMAAGTLPGEVVLTASQECGGSADEIEILGHADEIAKLAQALPYFHAAETDAQARKALRTIHRRIQ